MKRTLDDYLMLVLLVCFTIAAIAASIGVVYSIDKMKAETALAKSQTELNLAAIKHLQK